MIADLFPDDGEAIIVTGTNRHFHRLQWILVACQRCGSVVHGADAARHYRWHQAVDTGATTLLPSDSAPRLSGAGRPEPKDPQ